MKNLSRYCEIKRLRSGCSQVQRPKEAIGLIDTCSWSSWSLTDKQRREGGSLPPESTGPLGQMHACCGSVKAQPQHPATQLPSVVEPKTFPRSSSEHPIHETGAFSKPVSSAQSLLFGNQPDPDPGLQDFHEAANKRSIRPAVCVAGRGLVRNSAAGRSQSPTLRAEGHVRRQPL